VREAWRAIERKSDCQDGILFRADDSFHPIQPTKEAAYQWMEVYCNGKYGEKWRPSIFMRKWACRLNLTLASVRAERLQEITDRDALAEGVDRTNTSIPGYATERFKNLWDRINKKRGFGWEKNPWVWVLTFPPFVD
jgi:hypothetical protein